MATAGPTNLPAFFNVDADFQAWVQGIHNALAALGTLTQTADTGQINPATVVKPAANAVAGYEVWRFSDTLQATVPVFIKIEYAGGSPATRPNLYVTVGSGSNGAGTLTGQVGTRAQLNPSGDKTSGAVLPMYACNGGDGSALQLAVNIDLASSTYGFMFHVMRPRDNNGNPTNEGVVFAWWSIGSSGANIQFIPATGTIPGAVNGQMPFVSPWFFNRATGGENADVCPLLLPLIGTWRYIKLLFTGANDFGAGGTFQCTLFGATHTFLALNTTCGSINFNNNGNGGSPGVAMAWE